MGTSEQVVRHRSDGDFYTFPQGAAMDTFFHLDKLAPQVAVHVQENGLIEVPLCHPSGSAGWKCRIQPLCAIILVVVPWKPYSPNKPRAAARIFAFIDPGSLRALSRAVLIVFFHIMIPSFDGIIIWKKYKCQIYFSGKHSFCLFLAREILNRKS